MQVEHRSVVKCTLAEVMGWDKKEFGDGESALERAITAAFSGELEGEFELDTPLRFHDIRKSLYPRLSGPNFTHIELMTRFLRLQKEHQGSFHEHVCKLLWSDEKIGSAEIEVTWSVSKKRFVRAEKALTPGSSWVTLRYSLI